MFGWFKGKKKPSPQGHIRGKHVSVSYNVSPEEAADPKFQKLVRDVASLPAIEADDLRKLIMENTAPRLRKTSRKPQTGWPTKTPISRLEPFTDSTAKRPIAMYTATAY